MTASAGRSISAGNGLLHHALKRYTTECRIANLHDYVLQLLPRRLTRFGPLLLIAFFLHGLDCQ